jgi:hypothetical protein
VPHNPPFQGHSQGQGGTSAYLLCLGCEEGHTCRTLSSAALRAFWLSGSGALSEKACKSRLDLVITLQLATMTARRDWLTWLQYGSTCAGHMSSSLLVCWSVEVHQGCKERRDQATDLLH